MVDINETLLRQIVEDVLREMAGADKPVSLLNQLQLAMKTHSYVS